MMVIGTEIVFSYLRMNDMSENPFKPVKKIEDTDTGANKAVIFEFLGPKEAEAFASLVRSRDVVEVDSEEDVSLSSEDKLAIESIEHPWDRERYIEWARSIGRDEEWVDGVFIFKDDEVSCIDLRLDFLTELHEFPPNLKIERLLSIDKITSAEGVTLPQEVGGNVHLHELISAHGLTLPISVGNGVDLCNLISADGIILPISIKTSLILNSLTSSHGLKLPVSIGDSLHMIALTSSEGIILSEEFELGGDLYVGEARPIQNFLGKASDLLCLLVLMKNVEM